MNALLLVISTLMSTGKAVFCKAVGAGGKTKKERALLNFESLFVAFLCSLLFIIRDLRGLFEISGFSFILSIFFGLSVAFTQIMQSKAMGGGPSSTVTLIYSSGFLIPIFYGLIFWSESVSIFQWVGITLLVCSLILCVAKKEKRRKLSAWLPFALLAMLGSGANAIFQKTHQHSEFSSEISYYLVCCLFFSTLFTSLTYLFTKMDTAEEKRSTEKRGIFRKLILPLSLGICIGALNFLNLYLSGKLPSVILFPIYNVGSMLLISLICALVYKEKMSVFQKIGFAVGIVAILIIGLL